jgi:serine protease Do
MGTPTAARADTTSPARLSSAFRGAADRALPAVVSVRVRSEPRVSRGGRQILPFFQFPGEPQAIPPAEGQGSGIIIDAGGHILTNRHVVQDATELLVQLSDGREYAATTIGTDANTDVAVIKIEPRSGERLPAAVLGDSDALQVGDWVLALGNPLGLGITVTAGIVSAQGRSIGIVGGESRNMALESFIQTDAAINPGNSGGPLVDLQGRVVGVNTAIASRTGYYSGYGFAIPIALANRVAHDLIKYGVVRRPRLGILVQELTQVDAEAYGLESIAGAMVAEVQPGTPAASAGLDLGDVVIALDGQPIRTANDLTTNLARRQPGDRVRLTVIRDRKRREITVQLAQFETAEPRLAKSAGRPSATELLGFDAQPLTRELARRYRIEGAESGLVITGITEFSPAAARGVAPGQIVESINGEKVSTTRDLERLTARLEPGTVVSLIVRTPEGSRLIMNYRTRS